MCGEKRLHSRMRFCSSGSPPRVRGEVLLEAGIRKKKRITPACAGRSMIAKKRGLVNRDHPRVCGEKAAHRWELSDREGSPPRVRGEAHYIL